MVGLGLRLELVLRLELAYDWFRVKIRISKKVGVSLVLVNG